MRKINLNKKIFLFILAIVGYVNSKGQSCGTPITLTVNTGFTALDSTNLSKTYYKFTATNTQHAVKFYIKGISNTVNKAAIKTYTNNCGSLSTSTVSSIVGKNSDTLYVDMPTVTSGVQYLIELNNLGTSYLVNKISIGNNLLTGVSSPSLSCPTSSTCGAPAVCDLVCNGDFECLISPLGGASHIAYYGVWNWNCPSYGTADLFSSNSNPSPVGAPCNFAGSQNPYSSNNYAGFYAWQSGANLGSVEYIQTKLNSPLVAGKVYEISFYMSRADYSDLGINSIGAYLTNTLVSLASNTVLPFSASAINTNTALINDETNWQKISMTYTSTSGGEQYLTIGTPSGANTVTATGPASVCSSTGQFGPGTVYLYIDKVSVKPIIDVTISANPSSAICLGSSTTLSATTSYTSVIYNWAPVSSTNNTVSVSPTVTTVYTATVDYFGCIGTNTIAVTVNTACCTSTNPAFVGTSFPTSTLGGLTYNTPLVFNNDVTIPSGMVVTLSNTEYLFAPNVKLIVSPGAVLQLRGSHLYACGTSMWQGIVIQDGGAMNTNVSGGTVNHVLIEDALAGIDISNNTTSTITPIANLLYTTFNKNYIGVKVDNYQRNFTSNPVSIRECVFTSRNFTYTPTSWPKTTTTSPGLRYAATATTALVAPYQLQSASIVNLKAPYTNQSARFGIQINNSGVTSGANYYGVDVGDAGLESNFNLFDALMWSIDGTNSNFSSFNNVYQNSQRVYFCPRCYYDGGTAIRSTINTNLNAKLNLTSSGTYSANYSCGNRFWYCHKAVEATNVYRLDCNYATFRSTQTTTAATSALLLPGAYGIANATNRFEQNIRYNKFQNINNPIYMNVSTGTYTYGASSYSGILANNVLIDYNYFGAQLTNTTTIVSEFLNNAINLSSTSSTGWNSIGGIGLRISNNDINRAWRGAYVSTFGYATAVQNNTVSLLNDATIAATQRGISVANNLSGTSNIANNKLSAVNTTNTLVTLVYLGSSPVAGVTCNTLSASYQGFEFNSSSTGSTWKGNDMSNHARGMVLSNNGIIGTQGAASAPSDNRWYGSWTGSNYGTYVDGTSDAVNSKLWVNNSGVFTPPNPGFVFGLQSYAVATNTPNTTGTYSCGSIPPPQRLIFVKPDQTMARGSNPNSNINVEMQYIADNINYRYLDANPDIKNNDPEYLTFYNDKSGSSLDLFNQTEKALSAEQLAQAQSLNNSINEVISVETNYSNYYSLYEKYKSDTLSPQDSLLLLSIASMCPGIDGPIVYQARSLYNLYAGTLKVFNDKCESSSDEENTSAKITNLSEYSNKWKIELFPNPTTGSFSIVGSSQTELLRITITDVAGKIIYKNAVNTSNFIANLELNTKAGIYLINIKNSSNESVTKKLVISN